MNLDIYKKITFTNFLRIAGIFTKQFAFIGPHEVQIFLLNRCNSNCIFCGSYSPKSSKRRYRREEIRIDNVTYLDNSILDKNVVKRLIDDLYAIRTYRIAFAGEGEPLLHPDIVEIIHYIKDRPRKMFALIYTNGTALNGNMIDSFIESGVDEISLSLNSGSRENYTQVALGLKPADFDIIIDNLMYLKEQKNSAAKEHPRVVVTSVMNKYNYDQSIKIYKLARDVGAYAVTFLALQTGNLKEDISMNSSQLDTFLNDLKSIRKEAEYLSINIQTNIGKGTGGVRNYSGNIQIERCYIGWLFAAISPDGTTKVCCDCGYETGNINTQSFKQIWNNLSYRKFRKLGVDLKNAQEILSKGNCKECGHILLNQYLK